MVVLCRVLAVGFATVVGLSMGGMIAWHVVVEFPELVSSLVVADTTIRVQGNARQLLLGGATFVRGFGMAGLAPSNLHTDRITGGRLEEPPLPFRKAWRDFGSNDPGVYAQYLEALVAYERPDRVERLAKAGVEIPIVVVRGKHPLISAAEGTGLASDLGAVPFVTIEGGGHVSKADRPDLFNEVLARFSDDPTCVS